MAAVDEQVKLAFVSVSDLTKQLITLGTAVVTLEVTFAKVFFEKAVSSHWQAQASWILLLASLIAGIWVLMAVAGTQAGEATLTGRSLYEPNIRLPSLLQIVLFLLGMAFTIWFGVLASR